MYKVSKKLVAALIFMGALGSVGVKAVTSTKEVTAVAKLGNVPFPNSQNHWVAGDLTPLAVKIGNIVMWLGQLKSNKAASDYAYIAPGFSPASSANFGMASAPMATANTTSPLYACQAGNKIVKVFNGTTSDGKTIRMDLWGTENMIYSMMSGKDLEFSGEFGVNAQVDLSCVIYNLPPPSLSLRIGNWVDYGSTADNSFGGSKVYYSGNVCVLSGLTKLSTGNARGSQKIGQLPLADLYPKSEMTFKTNRARKVATVRIKINGEVWWDGDGGYGTDAAVDWISLNGIHYTTDGTESPFVIIRDVYAKKLDDARIAATSDDNLAVALDFLNKADAYLTSDAKLNKAKIEAEQNKRMVEAMKNIAISVEKVNLNSPTWSSGEITPLSFKFGSIAMLLGKVTTSKVLTALTVSESTIGTIQKNKLSPDVFFALFNGDNDGKRVRIDVSSTGNITYSGGATGASSGIDLSGIIFRTSGASIIAKPLTLSNCSQYDVAWGVPTVVKQGNFCGLYGLVRPSLNLTSYISLGISQLPVDFRPKNKLVFNTNRWANSTTINIATDGSVVWSKSNEANPDWISLNGISFTTDETVSPFDFVRDIYTKKIDELRSSLVGASDVNLALALKFLDAAIVLALPEAAVLKNKKTAIESELSLRSMAGLNVAEKQDIELDSLLNVIAPGDTRDLAIKKRGEIIAEQAARKTFRSNLDAKLSSKVEEKLDQELTDLLTYLTNEATKFYLLAEEKIKIDAKKTEITNQQAVRATFRKDLGELPAKVKHAIRPTTDQDFAVAWKILNDAKSKIYLSGDEKTAADKKIQEFTTARIGLIQTGIVPNIKAASKDELNNALKLLGDATANNTFLTASEAAAASSKTAEINSELLARQQAAVVVVAAKKNEEPKAPQVVGTVAATVVTPSVPAKPTESIKAILPTIPVVQQKTVVVQPTIPVNVPSDFILEVRPKTGKVIAIAVGSKNDGKLDAWCVTDDGFLWHSSGIGKSWSKQNASQKMKFKDVSVSSDGRVIVLGRDGSAYALDKSGWKKLGILGKSFTFKSISAGSANNILGVNPSSKIIYQFTKIDAEPQSQNLSNIGIDAVSVGFDGTVFGINGAGNAIKYENGAWKEMPGVKLGCIAVWNKDNIFGISSNGELWQCVNGVWVVIKGADGKPSEGLSRVAVNAAGTVFCVTSAGDVYRKGTRGFTAPQVPTAMPTLPSAGAAGVASDGKKTKAASSAGQLELAAMLSKFKVQQATSKAVPATKTTTVQGAPKQ